MENLDTKNYENIARERSLNDALRKFRLGGEIACTDAIYNLSKPDFMAVLRAVREYNKFDDELRPNNEHNYGVLTVNGHMISWVVRMQDVELEFPYFNVAPLNTEVRVLLIMLAEEY